MPATELFPAAITWLNRILFLKLLESQIRVWNKNANPSLFAFVNNRDQFLPKRS